MSLCLISTLPRYFCARQIKIKSNTLANVWVEKRSLSPMGKPVCQPDRKDKRKCCSSEKRSSALCLLQKLNRYSVRVLRQIAGNSLGNLMKALSEEEDLPQRLHFWFSWQIAGCKQLLHFVKISIKPPTFHFTVNTIFLRAPEERTDRSFVQSLSASNAQFLFKWDFHFSYAKNLRSRPAELFPGRKAPQAHGTKKTDMGQAQVQHHSIIWMSDIGYRCPDVDLDLRLGIGIPACSPLLFTHSVVVVGCQCWLSVLRCRLTGQQAEPSWSQRKPANWTSNDLENITYVAHSDHQSADCANFQRSAGHTLH